MSFSVIKKIPIMLCAIAMLSFSWAQAEENPVVTTVVEGKFNDILSAVKQGILGRGINIAHTLPASSMLSRTGPAFGINEQVFISAESIEFCSAGISHKLVKANPENIILCPFTISVYVLLADPGNVRISYRVPFTRDDAASTEAIAEMVELISGIVQDAADW